MQNGKLVIKKKFLFEIQVFMPKQPSAIETNSLYAYITPPGISFLTKKKRGIFAKLRVAIPVNNWDFRGNYICQYTPAHQFYSSSPPHSQHLNFCLLQKP